MPARHKTLAFCRETSETGNISRSSIARQPLVNRSAAARQPLVNCSSPFRPQGSPCEYKNPRKDENSGRFVNYPGLRLQSTPPRAARPGADLPRAGDTTPAAS